jgi:putative transposase
MDGATMGHVYYKIWLHIIWSTKNRAPLLVKEIRSKIYNHINKNASEKGYFIDKINGYADHIHILASLNPKFSISEAANNIKGESSHWINEMKLIGTYFSWQEGYSAFSVSESRVETVRKYIQEQEEHHRKQSYIEEIKELYKLHNIGFDEKYFL